MKRVNQLVKALYVSVCGDQPLTGNKFSFCGGGSLATRLLLIMAMMITVCASSGCTVLRPVYLANGTGRTLVFKFDGSSPTTQSSFEGGWHLLVSTGGNETLEICTLEGAIVHTELGSLDVNTYDGFDLHSESFIGNSSFPPDLSERNLVLLCNLSNADVLVVPVSTDQSNGSNVVSDGWRVSAGETEEFGTIATGQNSFHIYDPADTENVLASCSIDLSEGDQVIWDGVDLICKEAVVLDLVNTSAADVDIVWLEGKGNLMRTSLEPGESRSIGVPEGEVANFDAETNGTVVDSCILIDPMAGQQIVWDGTELVGCDPTDPPPPPPPPQAATIDLHNIGTSTGPVIVVEAGKDPVTDGIFIPRFEPGSLEVPTGAPVTIEVWDAEGIGGTNPHLYGQCTINDPTSGDSVTWDGIDVTCEDL